MKKILMSLKEFAYNDFINGNKKFEYRKIWVKEPVVAYVYVTGKVKKIMLKIVFDQPIYKSKIEIAKIAQTENPNWYNGILKYLEKYDFGFAIPAAKITVLKSPKNLEWMRKNTLNPPQSYQFLSNEQASLIEL